MLLQLVDVKNNSRQPCKIPREIRRLGNTALNSLFVIIVIFISVACWQQYNQYICTKLNVTNPLLIFHRQRSLNLKARWSSNSDIEKEEIEIVMNSMIYDSWDWIE